MLTILSIFTDNFVLILRSINLRILVDPSAFLRTIPEMSNSPEIHTGKETTADKNPGQKKVTVILMSACSHWII